METLIKSLSCVYIISLCICMIKYMVVTNDLMYGWEKEDKDRYLISIIIISTITSTMPIINTVIAYSWVLDLANHKKYLH